MAAAVAPAPRRANVGATPAAVTGAPRRATVFTVESAVTKGRGK